MKRIFISSTFLDLKEYREDVSRLLLDLKSFPVEVGGTSEDDATKFSLDILESCDVYLGIIGGRYGTISDDSVRSVTEREYDRAYELNTEHKMKIMLYVAGGEFSMPIKYIDENDNREKLVKFREKLKRHTPYLFKNFDDLRRQIVKDFIDLGFRPKQEEEKSKYILFDTNLDQIKDEFDLNYQERFKKIEDFTNKIIDLFKDVFKINQKNARTEHPLFIEMDKLLQKALPNVSFNEEEGTIKRSKIRHVVLRADTALELIKAVERDKLEQLGETIGKGAAKDLFKGPLEKYLPNSVEAFIALWDYWDKTGGWGKLELLNDSRDKENTTWIIKTHNNFLATKDPYLTHELCKFWCGYIKGVLNESLPGISRRMSNLTQDQRNHVRFPFYNIVSEVRHEFDHELKSDEFSVHFEKSPLSDEIFSLDKIQNILDDRHYIILQCAQILNSIKNKLPQIRKGLISPPFVSDNKEINIINLLLDYRLHIVEGEDISTLDIFNLVYFFIQKLSNTNDLWKK